MLFHPLCAAADSIRNACRNLVKVSKDGLKSGDELLKSQVPSACDQLDSASRLFTEATMRIKDDPFSLQVSVSIVTALSPCDGCHHTYLPTNQLG